MSTSTPNFNLTKPAGGENVDIATINSNMDKIDAGVEPIHKINTVEGSNGSITISNALDAPLIEFSATGMGTPSAVVIPDVIGAAMGQQDWDNPMILDVPLGVLHDRGDFLSSLFAVAYVAYGGGVGSNTYDPCSGTETGTSVYLTSKDLADLFDQVATAGTGTSVDEGQVGDDSFYRLEIPLPFSVASGSTVYCSHLQNKNVSGEEGIWASGSTLYMRLKTEHLTDDFEKAARRFKDIARKVAYYHPMTVAGVDMADFSDFFVYLTASASFTRQHDAVSVRTTNGSQTYDWMKIGDYLALFFLESEEDIPTLTALTNVSVTYYTDITVNRNLQSTIASAIFERAKKAVLGSGASATYGGAVGDGASADTGGAVGEGASAIYGGAVGEGASADTGGAVGDGASATYGGAVGRRASATYGGAVGDEASADTGGAVGSGAKTSEGFAGGYRAECATNGDAIDAIQLGTGTNSTVKSMQVYGTQLLYYHSTDNTHYIPLSLITASYSKADPTDQALFKQALGIS